MSSRKKLVISLSVVACVIVAAVIAVVAVLAATQQAITSNIKVTYTAMDVDATVTAKATIGGVDTAFYTADDKTSLVLEASEEDPAVAKTLAPKDELELTRANQQVTFTYTFTNTGSRDFTAAVEFDKAGLAAKNLKVTSETGDGATITVAAGAEATYTVVIAVDDMAKDVDFQFAFSWTLIALEA